MAVRFKAVTFDVDGTLYAFQQLPKPDPGAGDLEQRREFFRAYMAAREDVRAQGHVGDVHRLQTADIARRLGCSFERADELSRQYIHASWRRFSEVRPEAGVIELLEALQREGVRLGVISDYPAEEKLRGLGLDQLDWAVSIAAEPLGALKPHPAAYEQALERLGFEPAQVLHVGDRLDADVGGAKQVGMAAALYTGGNRLQWPGIGYEADLQFGDFRQLAAWLNLPLP